MSVETLKGCTLPAPKGCPGRAKVAWRVFHAQFFPVVPLHLSLSCRGSIWKSKRQRPHKGAEPRVGCGVEGRRVGRPKYGLGAAMVHQCPRRTDPISHQKKKKAPAGTGYAGGRGPRLLVTWPGCHFVAPPPFRAAGGRGWEQGSGGGARVASRGRSWRPRPGYPPKSAGERVLLFFASGHRTWASSSTADRPMGSLCAPGV